MSCDNENKQDEIGPKPGLTDMTSDDPTHDIGKYTASLVQIHHFTHPLMPHVMVEHKL